MAALNNDSMMWGANKGHTAFVLCLIVSSAAFAFSVMESSWRNANMDELTELPARRAMKQRFAGLGQRYTIAVLDIDHFKKVNDRYGHDTGDQVLRFIASFLKRLPRGKGYRYGGEEFVIISEGVSNEEFFTRMDDLRKAIASRKFIVRGNDRPKAKPGSQGGKSALSSRGKSSLQNRGVTITVSIGIATSGDEYYTPDEVFDAADTALYKAKRAGRNCVKVVR